MMNDQNKKSLIEGAVYLACAIVLFLSIIAFIACVKGGVWWAYPVPFALAVYGRIALAKKYYPKKD